LKIRKVPKQLLLKRWIRISATTGQVNPFFVAGEMVKGDDFPNNILVGFVYIPIPQFLVG
jgi:hypothetical protein